MKRIFAMMLAALLLTGSCAALAEETEEKPFIDFDIRPETVPEGYTYEVEDNGGSLYATFTKKDDPDAAVIYVSAAYSDEFEGFTLQDDLSDEQMANMEAILTQCYNDPAVAVMEGENGTKYIVVSENDSQTDYADIVTIWKGYVIDISLQKTTQITDEDMDLAARIAQNMWVAEE